MDEETGTDINGAAHTFKFLSEKIFKRSILLVLQAGAGGCRDSLERAEAPPSYGNLQSTRPK